MKTIIKFNTGRSYTKNGQQIAAIQLGYDIYFVDASRGIDGMIKNMELNEGTVMAAYDGGFYKSGNDENSCGLKMALAYIAENK